MGTQNLQNPPGNSLNISKIRVQGFHKNLTCLSEKVLEKWNPHLKAEKNTQWQFPSNFETKHVYCLVWDTHGYFHGEWQAWLQHPPCEAAHSELLQFLADIKGRVISYFGLSESDWASVRQRPEVTQPGFDCINKVRAFCYYRRCLTP